jgi:hypothetical protein
VLCELVNLSKLILYKRETGQCFVSLVNVSKLILYKRERNRTVLCEFSESIEVDTAQKREKQDSAL